MLEILGMIGGNALSLPGILGVAFGMMTRNWVLAILMGAIVGVLETIVFAGFSPANVEVLELVISILVGMAAGVIGTAIRHKGAAI